MPNKSISWVIYNPKDKVVSIVIGSTTYSANTCEELCSTYSTIFSLQAAGPILQLCAEVDSSIAEIDGNFQQVNTLTNYTLQSLDFVGGQPQRPPWLKPL